MDIFQRLKKYAGLNKDTDRCPSNPCITVREAIEIADEIERLRKQLEANNPLLEEAADKIDELEVQRDELLTLLERYRNETPVGHQPHMICHVVDDAIARIKGAE